MRIKTIVVRAKDKSFLEISKPSGSVIIPSIGLFYEA